MWIIRNTTGNIKHAIWQLRYLKSRYWKNVMVGLFRSIGRDTSIFFALTRIMADDKKSCSHDPRIYSNQPMGMYHCPECGEMVLAGMPHPNYSLLDTGEREGK